MKYWIAVSLLFLISLSVYSQDFNFQGMAGLRLEKGGLDLEFRGYNIHVFQEEGRIEDTKTIKSVKKDYKIGAILTEFYENKFGQKVKVIEAVAVTREKPGIEYNQAIYLFNRSETGITGVFFHTHNQRDAILEEEIVRAYLENGLTDYLIDEDKDVLSFVGRDIPLLAGYKRKGPHNVEYGDGQISWAEFPSFEEANIDINNSITANGKIPGMTILMEDDLDVLFEEIPSVAHRVAFGQKGGNYIIVYYIVQEIRGRYVSCILSNYGSAPNDYNLAPLLQQVMNIPVLPDVASEDIRLPEDYVMYNAKISSWEVRAGTWIPVGNLSNVFGVAPSIGGYLGFPFNMNMALDIGAQIAFPVDRQQFRYYHNDRYSDLAKSDLLVTVAARWRYQQEIARNVYWSPYIGVGWNMIQTNQKKDDYDDNESAWYTIDTFDLSGGVILRYKKVGCFVEYHYAPYSIAGKVRERFGNSAINVGISFGF